VITIDRDVVIAREPEVVFDYLADVANYPRWQPAIERAEQVTPGPLQRGSQVKLLLRAPTGPTEILAEIVEFARPTALAIDSLTGPAEIKARCALEATAATEGAGNATRFHLAASIELKGFLRFAEGPARKVIDRDMPIVLADLVHRIESGA